MKAAFSCWDGRIAPVFDTATHLRLIEARGERVVGERLEMLPREHMGSKVLRLVEMGAAVLVCGAISRPLQAQIEAYGIKVTPFVAGEVEEVIRAWLSGVKMGEAFSMPGCRGRGRGRSRGRRIGAGCRGKGGAGVPGYCVCPRCGFAVPHERGRPCTGRMCPECGEAMTRQ